MDCEYRNEESGQRKGDKKGEPIKGDKRQRRFENKTI